MNYLNFDGTQFRFNCVENDDSREPLEKSEKKFHGFDIIFWSLLIDNERCCANIYGIKGVPCL